MEVDQFLDFLTWFYCDEEKMPFAYVTKDKHIFWSSKNFT